MSLHIYSPSSRVQVGLSEGLFGVEVPFFGGMLENYHCKLGIPNWLRQRSSQTRQCQVLYLFDIRAGSKNSSHPNISGN
jgi:hypothetical protein